MAAALPGLGGEPGQASGPAKFVRPMVGTSGHGHTFPGAIVPFGMVQLSPDTRGIPGLQTKDPLWMWDGSSGYHYSDDAILGFSHMHFSGTGCPDLGDFRFMPISGELPPAKAWNTYRAKFSHADETARPGYYSVVFKDPAIKVELTATARAGLHRYTFPAGSPQHLIVDLARGIGNQPIAGRLVLESDARISGSRRSAGWAKDKTYFFVAEFSRPFQASQIDVDGKPSAEPRQGSGKQVMAALDFPQSPEPLLVKVGISAVSVEGARKNLAAEIPAFDFEAVAAAAEKAWNDTLGRIEVEAADPATRETFYSCLYHACTGPTLYNDVDGSYRGADHKVHAGGKRQHYTTYSLWDTFRAEHPLLTFFQPQRVNDFVNEMLTSYREFAKHALPIWPVADCETWCMIGNHAIPMIVDAYAKGFRDYDVEAVYQAVRDSATFDRLGMGDYDRRGYVISANRDQSVSRTLEYAYDDWCVARFAKMLGKDDDAAYFAKRAKNYRNLFDPSVGFMRGRTADGKWRKPFDPRELVWADYTEANAWNYTWHVQQDVPGLIALLGGDRAFAAKLDQMYHEDSKLLAAVPDMSGLIGQYVHGNEPCHHDCYLFNYAGAAWRTQEHVRQVMNLMYNNTVEGCCGNDDVGQMSAWYVLSAMGFYPVNAASGVYVIGSPAVDRATIHLDPRYSKGGTFTVIAQDNSPQNVYVQSATLNGKPLSRSWFSHAELVAGGELVLKMGPKPNPAWGAAPEDRPPAAAE
jgi:predicted alpha-1,2-mannosidase